MSLFQTSRELPAPPDAVFAVLGDPARLARWWGPDGFTNTFHAFEFEPGAKVVVRHVSAPVFTLTIGLHPCAAGTRVTWDQAFDNPAVAAAVRHIVEPANEQNLDRLAQELARA